MKTIKLLVTLLSVGLLLSVFSCRQQGEKKGAIEEEMEDVKQELSDTIKEEMAAFKKEMRQSLDEYGEKIDTYEKELEELQTRQDVTLTNMLNDLKARRDSITTKIEEIDQKTADEWEEFKAEIRHDVNQYIESVKAFFEDNE